jgi:predicted ATP-grasp superfamily ATP-dependent carboligase
MRVLITDGDERAALAAARSLTGAGYEVYAVSHRRRSLAGVSRGVRSVRVLLSALEQPGPYVAELSRITGLLGIQVLLPVTDAAVEAVLDHRALLPGGVRVPLPPVQTYRRASDKLETLRLAQAAGFAVPETVVLESPDTVPSLPETFFPGVLKPHRSVVRDANNGARTKLAVSYFEDRASLISTVRLLPRAAFPVLLQQRVAGFGEALFAFRHRRRMLAQFAHRRLREKPPAGGVSVYRESIALDPELASKGARLLESLEWEGLAMVECKRDPVTGRHVFMEINGRLWGSLQLAVDADVNFVALLMAAEREPAVTLQPVTTYRVGVRSRWFWGDVDHLYQRLTRSPEDLHLTNGSTSRLRALREFFRVRLGVDREEIWRWRDPLPFIVETLRWLAGGR